MTENIKNYVLCVIVVVIGFMYIYFQWAFSYWKRRGVLHQPPTIPFGNAYRIIARKIVFGELFKEIYDTYKAQALRYGGFYLFTKPCLIIVDPELIKTILTKDFHHFTDHGNYVDEEREPLTGTLFALKGDKWKRLRTKLTPVFSSEKLKIIFSTLLDCSNMLKELMDEMVQQREPVEVQDLATRYVTDAIGACAFGLDCNSLRNPNSEFRKLGRIIFDFNIFQALVRFLSFTFPQLLRILGLKFLSKDVTKFIMNLVKDTVDYREKNNIKRSDFMDLLIQLKNIHNVNDDGYAPVFKKNQDVDIDDGFTLEQIAAQALLFFLAGFETPSTTLTFFLYEMVSNQGVQEELRDEVLTVLKRHNGDITYDGLLELTYMDKCIQETLRKYPPIPTLFRECTQNYVIPETSVTIEKGIRVFIPILGVHRDNEYYPNPEKFDPERFSVENRVSRYLPVWLPFGKGHRSCIGMRFGVMQVKLALVVLLRNYQFSLNNRTETPILLSSETTGLTPKNSIWLNVKKVG